MKIIVNIDESKIVGLDIDYVRSRILAALKDATDYGAIEEYIWDEYEVNDDEAQRMAMSVEDSVEILEVVEDEN